MVPLLLPFLISGLILLILVSTCGAGGTIRLFIVVISISILGVNYGLGSVILLSISVIFMLLVFAIFLQGACGAVAGFRPADGTAFKASSRAFLVWVIALKIEDHFGHKLINDAVVSMLVVVCFLVQSAIYSKMLTTPETGAVSFGKACLISLVQITFAGLSGMMFSMFTAHG